GKDHKCARSKDATDPTKLAAIALPTTNGCWRQETRELMTRSAPSVEPATSTTAIEWCLCLES
ncbi:MAG: hypothetical protein WEB67_07670, partial [Acidimicrobiia bacterium]